MDGREERMFSAGWTFEKSALNVVELRPPSKVRRLSTLRKSDQRKHFNRHGRFRLVHLLAGRFGEGILRELISPYPRSREETLTCSSLRGEPRFLALLRGAIFVIFLALLVGFLFFMAIMGPIQELAMTPSKMLLMKAIPWGMPPLTEDNKWIVRVVSR